MKPMISEFSYGYALTEELASGVLGSVIGAPIFPSLYEEGQENGGYDLELPRRGTPLYLQFKLSYYMKHRSSGEWDDYSEPYYRMYLRPLRHSKQYALLLAWESNGHEAYYVAPVFNTAQELDTAYTSRTVFYRSAFFRPNDLGDLPDDKEHYVVFHPTILVAYLCSRARRSIHPPLLGRALLQKKLTKMKQEKQTIDKTFFDNIAGSFLSVLSDSGIEHEALQQLGAKLRRGVTLREAAQFAAYLSRTYLDAELVVFAEKEDR